MRRCPAKNWSEKPSTYGGLKDLHTGSHLFVLQKTFADRTFVNQRVIANLHCGMQDILYRGYIAYIVHIVYIVPIVSIVCICNRPSSERSLPINQFYSVQCDSLHYTLYSSTLDIPITAIGKSRTVR